MISFMDLENKTTILQYLIGSWVCFIDTNIGCIKNLLSVVSVVLFHSSQISFNLVVPYLKCWFDGWGVTPKLLIKHL